MSRNEWNEILRRYGLALGVAAAAFSASLVTSPYLRSSPWIFFFSAVILSAWFGGQGPSLAATAFLTILGRYVFMSPYYSLSLNRETFVQVVGFVGVSVAIGHLAAARRRAEEQERAEQRRFQATVTSMGEAVVTTDRSGRVAFMNSVAEGLTGWSFPEAKGRRLEDVFVVVREETGEPAPSPIARAMGTRRIPETAERTLLLSKDGSKRAIDDSAAPIRNGAGELTGVVLVFRDVTEKNRVARALAESEERYRTLFGRMSEGFCVIEMIRDDERRPVDYRFLVVNRAFEEHTGLKDAAGKTSKELGAGHPRHWYETFDRVAESGEPVRFVDAERVMGRWLDVSAFRVGEPGRWNVAILFTDITDRRREEEAKELRAKQLQHLAEIATRINSARDVASVIGLVTEEARNLVGARQAATSMVSIPNQVEPVNVVSTEADRRDVRAVPVLDAATLSELVDAESRPIRLAREDLAKDPRWSALGKGELVAPTEGGLIAAPLVGRDGKCVGLLQLADKVDGDFTEDDEAVLVQLSRLAVIAVENAWLYEELRGNDRRKDEFLAMLAHELRNPLAAIVNAVAVSAQAVTKDDQEWSTGVISRQIRHLTRLIDDLLDVSRINRGKIELRREVVEATPILESAVVAVMPLVAERGHRIETSIDRGNLWIDADPTRIEQSVVNLLSNAAKYSGNGKRIWLSGRNEGGDVVVSVRDEGVGVPPEKLPLMFELFAQGDRSLARSEGGLGIGLTVVKRLVEMHGGTIAARSEGPGKGSEFTIRLASAARPSGGDPKSPDTTRKADKRARILVVDDNVDFVVGVSLFLSSRGHDVASAHNGLEAIATAREFNPDYVLLDIGLPGMDGYEVATSLRREERCKDTVIVAVSGYGQDAGRRLSQESGFDYRLIKPLDHDALLAVLSGDKNRRGR